MFTARSFTHLAVAGNRKRNFEDRMCVLRDKLSDTRTTLDMLWAEAQSYKSHLETEAQWGDQVLSAIQRMDFFTYMLDDFIVSLRSELPGQTAEQHNGHTTPASSDVPTQGGRVTDSRDSLANLLDGLASHLSPGSELPGQTAEQRNGPAISASSDVPTQDGRVTDSRDSPANLLDGLPSHLSPGSELPGQTAEQRNGPTMSASSDVPTLDGRVTDSRDSPANLLDGLASHLSPGSELPGQTAEQRNGPTMSASSDVSTQDGRVTDSRDSPANLLDGLASPLSPGSELPGQTAEQRNGPTMSASSDVPTQDGRVTDSRDSPANLSDVLATHLSAGIQLPGQTVGQCNGLTTPASSDVSTQDGRETDSRDSPANLLDGLATHLSAVSQLPGQTVGQYNGLTTPASSDVSTQDSRETDSRDSPANLLDGLATHLSVGSQLPGQTAGQYNGLTTPASSDVPMQDGRVTDSRDSPANLLYGLASHLSVGSELPGQTAEQRNGPTTLASSDVPTLGGRVTDSRDSPANLFDVLASPGPSPSAPSSHVAKCATRVKKNRDLLIEFSSDSSVDKSSDSSSCRSKNGPSPQALVVRTSQTMQQPTAGTLQAMHQPTAGILQTMHQPTAGILQTMHQPTSGTSQPMHQPPAGISQTVHQPPGEILQTMHQPTAGTSQTLHQSTAGISKTMHQPTAGPSQTMHQSIAGTSQTMHQSIAATSQSMHQPIEAAVPKPVTDAEQVEEVDPNISVVKDDDPTVFVLPRQMTLETDQQYVCYVTYAESPSEFYIILNAPDEKNGPIFKLDKLTQEMEEYYGAHKVDVRGIISDMKYCVVRQDDEWCRCYIDTDGEPDGAGGGAAAEEVKVFYVDYGGEDVVPLHSVQPLVPQFCEQPPYAYLCHLIGVDPANGAKWSHTAREMMMELSVKALLKLVVEDNSSESLGVRLLLPSGTSVASRLLALGLAVANTPSPAANAPSPTANTPSPAANTTSPAANTTSLTTNTPPPTANSTSLTANTPSPAANTTSPAANSTTMNPQAAPPAPTAFNPLGRAIVSGYNRKPLLPTPQFPATRPTSAGYETPPPVTLHQVLGTRPVSPCVSFASSPPRPVSAPCGYPPLSTRPVAFPVNFVPTPAWPPCQPSRPVTSPAVYGPSLMANPAPRALMPNPVPPLQFLYPTPPTAQSAPSPALWPPGMYPPGSYVPLMMPAQPIRRCFRKPREAPARQLGSQPLGSQPPVVAHSHGSSGVVGTSGSIDKKSLAPGPPEELDDEVDEWNITDVDHNYTDPLLAVQGYRNRDEADICKHYKGPPATTCFKKDCKKKHILIHPEGWTLDKKEVLRQPQPLTLPAEGSRLRLNVTHVDNFNHFYVQILQHYTDNDARIPSKEDGIYPKELLKLIKDMNTPSVISTMLPLNELPSVGEMVATWYPDKMLYRAQVLGVDDEHGRAQVRYVDFGNRCWTLLKQVYRLDQEFLLLPFQAAPCSLAGVAIKSGADLVLATDSLRALIQEKIVIGTVITLMSVDTLVLELEDTEGFSLAETLHAQHKELFTYAPVGRARCGAVPEHRHTVSVPA